MTTARTLSWTMLALTVLVLLPGPHPMLGLATGATLMLGLRLLWPDGGTPVLLLPFLLQWLQVSVKPIQSAISRVDINLLAERGANLQASAWFGLLGLTALAIGLALGGPSRTKAYGIQIAQEASRWPKGLILSASISAIFAGHALSVMADQLWNLRQPLLMLADIRLAGLFLMTYWALSQNKGLTIVGPVLLLETVLGMTGFYGEFKSTFLVVGLAALLAKPRVSLPTILLGTSLMAVMTAGVIFWSAIKQEYRVFLSQGDVTWRSDARSLDARLDFLQRALSDLGDADIQRGADRLVARLSYIDFIGHTLAYVPAQTPHTGGTQTATGIRHILTPRILFPEKPPVEHDTFVTARYTGIHFSVDLNYVSISIGYQGEFYIDFGYTGALLAMLILGVMIGRMYAVLIAYEGLPKLFNTALATMAMLPFCFYERALVKMMGSGVTIFIVCLLLQRVGIPLGLRLLGFGALLETQPAPVSAAQSPEPPSESPGPHAQA